ncbi:hypothetical protein [Haloferax sp. DFSO60]|uniref:DUF7289 family protein n=1 Tax=Haloferax sp. DFSO60 TaxID=3388652 RepID=UPI00397CA0AF
MTRFARDSRGVSEILGLILAFGLVVSVIAVVQMAGTPVWTAGDEAEHNARVSSDLATLDSAVFRTAGFDQQGSVAVETDLTYQNRYISLSPPDSTGVFTTSDAQSVRLDNAKALGSESVYWNGTNYTFDGATTLRYAPQYTERESQSLVIESGVSYLDADGDIVVNRQSLVSGTTVNLVILEGDLDGHTTAGETVSLSAVSTRTEPLPVSDDGSPIRITVPTSLSEAVWGDLLADEPYASVVPDGNPNTVTVELAAGQTYDLRIARISIGTALESTDAKYLVVEEGDLAGVPAGGNQTLVVRAFDEYGAPAAGAQVTVANPTPLGGTVVAPDGSTTARTDESGRARFTYTARSDVTSIQPDNVTVSLAGVGGPAAATTIDLEVRGVGDSYNVRNADPDVDADPDASPDADPDPAPEKDFDIEDGTVIPSGDFTGDFELLGSAIKAGWYDVPVRVTFVVGGTPYAPDDWENVNDGEERAFNASGTGGDGIVVIAEAEGYVTASSADDDKQVRVLRNGDPVPDIKGFDGQDDVEAFVAPYISDDGTTMELDDNQAIFLFELGSTNEYSSAFDMQDAVILVTLWEDDEA